MVRSHPTAMPAQDHPVLSGLQRMTATDVLNRWGALVKTVNRGPGVAITSHGDVELVVISRERAEELERTIFTLKAAIAAAGSDPDNPAAGVEALRQRFLERLQGRDEDQVRRSIRAAAEDTIRLDGQLHVDDRF